LCNMQNLKEFYIDIKLLNEQAKLVIERCRKRGIEIF